MKLNKIGQFLIFTTLIASTGQILPVTPLNTAELYKEIGYINPKNIEDAYNAGITQAASGLEAPVNINKVISGLTAAAKADPDATFAQMMNGQTFGRTNLAKIFTTNSELEAIITPVAQAFDSVNSPSYISQYVDAGIADANFTQAMNDITTGIKDGNLQDVLDGLKIVTSYPGDRYLGRLQVELASVGSSDDPASALSDALISQFDTADIITICKAANLDNSDILEIYEANQAFLTNVANIQTAYETGNAADMANLISAMAKTDPNLMSNLFQNGNALDYQTLKAGGFTDPQIEQIAQAAGLAPADVTSYLAGKYTGASDNIPVIPGQDPTNPINPGTGNQPGENIPGAQEYYTLTEVTAANLQQLITQNQLTKTEFNELLANQEANLAKLKESDTATQEEIAEMQNEINISKQVAADPETKFAPETVDPVVA